MSSYRLNLTIDEEFSTILQYLKNSIPLSSDISIIRDAISKKYLEQKTLEKKIWEGSLPTQKLSKKQILNLEKNIEESIQSGNQNWDKDSFINQMME